MTPPFPSWLEVDLDAVESNVAHLRDIVGPECRVAAVVKAQAYGLARRRSVERQSALALASSRWRGSRKPLPFDEPDSGTPILILSAIAPAEASRCCQYDLTPTVTDAATVALLDRVAEGLGCNLSVHLKVDTGLTRYGAQIESAVDLGRRLACCRSLVVDGLYTHFSSSDEPDLAFTYEQIERFLVVQSQLAQAGLRFPPFTRQTAPRLFACPRGDLTWCERGSQ